MMNNKIIRKERLDMKNRVIKAFVAGLMSVSIMMSSTICSFAQEDDMDEFVWAGLAFMSSIFDVEKGLFGNGEDLGYKADVNIKLGEAVLAGMNSEAGIEIKPIDISAIANSKDGKTAADLSVKYDSKPLFTLDTFYDNAADKMYLRIPELNDAYIAGTSQDYEKSLENLIKKLYEDEYDYDDDEEYYDGDEDDEAYKYYEKLMKFYQEFNPVNAVMSLKDMDVNELIAHVLPYADVVKEKLPESKTGEPETVEIGNKKYDLTTKTYSMTSKDLYDIFNDVVGKIKTDEYFKDLASKIGINEEIFDLLLDNEEIVIDEEDYTEKVDINVYYNGSDIAGIGLTDEYTSEKLVFILDDNAIRAKKTSSGYGSTDTTDFELTDVDIEDGKLNFNLKVKNYTTDSEEGTAAQQIFDITSTGTVDKHEITAKVSTDENTEIATVTLNGEVFEPTAVELPTENVYDMAQDGDLEKYIETCDVEGFVENLKNALGNELFEMLKNMWNIGNAKGEDEPEDSIPDVEPQGEAKDTTALGGSADKGNQGGNKSSDAGSKNSGGKSSGTASGSDSSANTGKTAGIAICMIALSGAAIIVSKKK